MSYGMGHIFQNGENDGMSVGNPQMAPDTQRPGIWADPYTAAAPFANSGYDPVDNATSPDLGITGSGEWAQYIPLYPDTRQSTDFHGWQEGRRHAPSDSIDAGFPADHSTFVKHGQSSQCYQPSRPWQPGSSNPSYGMSNWPTQQAPQNPEGFVIGMFPEPWSTVHITAQQQALQYTDDESYDHCGVADGRSSGDNSYDRASFSCSNGVDTGTSNTSWPVPDVMVNSEMTITQQFVTGRRSNLSDGTIASPYHSMVDLDVAQNYGGPPNPLPISDDAAECRQNYLSVPDESFRNSRSPSPVPSGVSITSARHPDVLLCFKEGCRAMFTGKYRRGNRQRHMRLKHGEDVREYACEVKRCGKTFMRQDARLKHYRKKHPHRVRDPAQPSNTDRQ